MSNLVSKADFPVALRESQVLSASEFQTDVETLASRINTAGPRCCLASKSAYRFAVGFLALLHSKKTIVLPASCTPGALAECKEIVDAFVTDEEGLDELPTEGGAASSFQLSPIEDGQIELYTSGSSGDRKCVKKTLAQLGAEVEVLESLWGNTIGDSLIVSTVSHQHIYGLLFKVLWPLTGKRVIYDSSTLFPAELAKISANYKVCLVSSPAHLKRVRDKELFENLRQRATAIFSSGSMLAEDISKVWTENTGLTPIEVYGSTETGGVAWRQQADEAETPWKLLPGVKIQQTSKGAQVSSPFTEVQIIGDNIELLQDEQFLLKGRSDNIVKIEDKRFAPLEMERRIKELDLISDAKIIISSRGERAAIAAALVLAAEATEDVFQTIGNHLGRYFDPVLLPKRWRVFEEFPRDEQGKIDRTRLEKTFSPPLQTLGAKLLLETKNKVSLECTVPKDLPHFDGHFEGHPVVPGFVQVAWVMEAGSYYFHVPAELRSLSRAKFNQMLVPGTRFLCDLERDKSTISYRLHAEDAIFAQGKLEPWSSSL